MKMPEPIIDPATSIVESSKPSPRTNFPRQAQVTVSSCFRFFRSARVTVAATRSEYRLGAGEASVFALTSAAGSRTRRAELNAD